MPRSLTLLALALTLTTTAAARELDVLGAHTVTGTHRGQPLTGRLVIRDDATFELDAHTPQPLQGIARIESRLLVLDPTGGHPPLRFARDDDDSRVAWRADLPGGGHLRWSGRRHERPLALALRVLTRGETADWLLDLNRGWVDADQGGPRWIERCRQPRPEHVLDFADRGVRTVLSLNGDQDELVPYARLDGARLAVDEVNLRAWIAEHGLAHVSVGMSASRAPSDAELVRVFSVLLDDAAKPIVLHCRGGADRTGVISALYRIEFLGWSKAEAKREMRRHCWAANDGTEIQGAYLDLYRLGHLRAVLADAGVEIPPRYRLPRPRRVD